MSGIIPQTNATHWHKRYGRSCGACFDKYGFNGEDKEQMTLKTA